MSSANELSSFIEREFTALEKSINGSSKSELHAFRKQSLKTFNELPFPTTKDEEWKYTNIKAISDSKYSSHKAEATSELVLSESFGSQDAIQLVLINGHISKELSSIKDLSGLTIQPLDEALNNNSTGADSFGKIANNSEKFTSLNSAFTGNGIYIHVSKNQVVEQPIYIIHINAENESTVSHPRLLMIVEENAQVKVCEKSSTSNNESIFENAVCEILVGKNALVEHYQITPDSDNLSKISTTSVIQEAGSKYHHSSFTFGGDTIRNNLNVKINGEYSETFMNGLYLVDGNSHIDNHTAVDHAQPNSYSNELYKGILDGNATAVFNGKVFVRQIAQKTNAFQSNKNVLLSDDATINTKPQLEIWADDVKCSHGATTGQLDEEALFYLQARGISPKNAKKLLLEAFANEVMERVSLEPVKDYIAEMINLKLHG